jgi:hypothetical protein
MAEGWAREEVEALADDYFGMLDHEFHGRPYSKTARRAALAPLLNSRSTPSIEVKHANVSAILIELGFPYISGYKPRGNYQHLLREVVVDRLLASPAIVQSVEADVDLVSVAAFEDVLAALVQPPTARELRSPRSRRLDYASKPNPFSINYLEREAHNRRLGLLGEEFVVSYEQARLLRAGKDRLSEKVEHVSRTRGDGLGFDVLSFDDTGRNALSK